MIGYVNDLLSKWEPLWLFLILFAEALAGFGSLYILIKEYKYDEQKDIEKKQRRTRTTKKVTTHPGGDSVSEETIEVTEPSNEEKKA